jgi:uncharacterized protein
VAERLLIESIPGELAAAMRARDQDTLSALRMLKTALTNKRVELARTLEPADELQVLTTLVKQRRDSIDQFTRAGRQELADQERRELAVLERYLPPAVDDATLQTVIAEVIAETGASSASDVGRVMKAVMGRLSGQLVDGKAVSAHVRAALA